MHLGVELLQYLDETEELRDGVRVPPAHREEVQHNEVKHAQVAKPLLSGQDDGHADPCGHPQRVLQRQAPV